MTGSAVISEDGKYRYRLERQLSEGDETCVFIMLNPSTADADIDDPTIRRCMGFAKSWGYHKLVVVNLFAYRATSPVDMKAAEDPIGPENMTHILSACTDANTYTVIAAWGNHGSHKMQDSKVMALLQEHLIFLKCLDKTKTNAPKHPLYVKADITPRLLAP